MIETLRFAQSDTTEMIIGLITYGSLETISGWYLYDRKLVEYLRAQGDTVEIISLPWRNYAAHLTDNFWFRLPQSSVLARSREAATKQSPNDKGFDILIQDELNHPSLIRANFGMHAYPIISLVHHLRCSEFRPAWQNAFYRWVEGIYLQSVDGLILNSKTTRGMIHGLIGDGKPCIVAFPPTDRFGERITEDEIKERAKSSELRVLFLGNVIYRKGLHTLLESVKSLRQQPELAEGSNVRLDVVGGSTAEPKYAVAMKHYVAVNDLSSAVRFHGALDHQPLIEMYKQAHVLVVPSNYEGYGIVYLEGMGFGLPAIGTTAGGAREIISDGVDGFLIEPGNAESLANRLELLNEKRELLIQLSLAARSRYIRQPKWEETAGQIRGFLLQQIQESSV